jgi:hypothetical protein
VVSLTYTLLVPASENYERASPVDTVQTGFQARLGEGKLKVTMNAHFASVDDARVQVDSFLSAWEMDAFLRGRKIGFSFLESEVIDRSPPATIGNVLNCTVGAYVITSGKGKFTLHRMSYPEAPKWTTASAMAQRMYARFVAFMEGRESIFSTAYYCLTELQVEAGGSVTRGARDKAVTRFRIDRTVLDTLGDLSSERGDPLTARKAGASPLAPAESNWLNAAVPQLIRHVAALDGGDMTTSTLTMAELPIL